LKRLLIIFSAIILLSACAVPQVRSEKIDPAQDLSKPNPASIYFFLSGSYLFNYADFISAEQVLELASVQDIDSPQIKKLRLKSAAYAYIFGQDENFGKKTVKLMLENKELIKQDKELLQLAYNVFEFTKEREAQDWALDTLLKDHPDAKAWFWEFVRQKESGKKPKVKLLNKALKDLDDPTIKQLIAREYEVYNPTKAINIVKELPKNQQSDQLLLRIYRNQNMIDQLTAHIKSYLLPQEQALAMDYLFFLDNNDMSEIVFGHTDYLLSLENYELIRVLSIIAYMRDDDATQKKLFAYLQKQKPDMNTGEIYNFLLLHELKHPNTLPFEELAHGVYASGNLSRAIFVAMLHPDYRGNKQKDDEAAAVAIAKQCERLPESALKGFLLINVSMEEIIDHSPAQRYSEELVNRGVGGIEDFQIVIDQVTENKDIPAQIKYLRMAVQRYPDDAQCLNNLGYLLLENSGDLNEAERLISQALRKDPQQHSYIDSMAWLRYLQKDYAKALKQIKKIDIQEGLPSELLYHMGMIYLANDMPERASEVLKMAIAADDDEDYVKKASQALDEMTE